MTSTEIPSSQASVNASKASTQPKGSNHDIERDLLEAEEKPADTPNDADPDPNLVDFDGPDDPENPRNWSPVKRTMSILLVTLMTLLSYSLLFLSSYIEYLP